MKKVKSLESVAKNWNKIWKKTAHEIIKFLQEEGSLKHVGLCWQR